MGKIDQRLATVATFGLDSSVFIYHLESHPTYLPMSQILFSGIEKGKWAAITSVISLMEICVLPLRFGQNAIARKYEAILVNFPNLHIVDVTRDITRRATQLRAEYRLRPPDAIQAATCLMYKVKTFITNDRQFTKLESILDVIILDDFK